MNATANNANAHAARTLTTVTEHQSAGVAPSVTNPHSGARAMRPDQMPTCVADPQQQTIGILIQTNQRVRIVGETSARYRIEAMYATVLGGGETLEPGEAVMLPKWAVRKDRSK